MSTCTLRALSACLLPMLSCSLIAVSGCSSDPYDPQTWIEKIEDNKDVAESITKLEQLECPEAIPALGALWESKNRSSQILGVIIGLADQPQMVAGHPDYPNQDCKEGTGEGPYWEAAVPFLITAVEDFDVSDNEEIQLAAKAAEALGKAKSEDAIQTLISAATKKEKLRQGMLVRLAAIKALGEFPENKRAVDTLVKILGTEPTRDTVRLNAQAANALSHPRSGTAVLPLLKALYEIAPIYPQVRIALTTIGKPAVPELIRVFKGKHSEINKIADKHKFAKDCSKGLPGPNTDCTAPGNLRFNAARILGDLGAKEAIGPLVSALSNPEQISFFLPNGTAGPSDHTAILDTLRKLGAYKSADDISKYMQAESTNDVIRPLAMDVYSTLARDTKGLAYLQKSFEDKDNEMSTREVATIAYARLVKSTSEIGPIQEIIDRQLKSARESDKKARREKKPAAKKEHEETANGFRRIARQYEQYRTQARTGVVCGSKIACYQEILNLDGKGIVAKLKIPNHRRESKKPMKKQDMQLYRLAAIERALLEIAKMEQAGKPAFDDLLVLLESTERVIRKGVLAALVQVAPSPCNACVGRLNEIIDLQSGQSTLDYLTADTKIVRNYFAANISAVK